MGLWQTLPEKKVVLKFCVWWKNYVCFVDLITQKKKIIKDLIFNKKIVNSKFLESALKTQMQSQIQVWKSKLQNTIWEVAPNKPKKISYICRFVWFWFYCEKMYFFLYWYKCEVQSSPIDNWNLKIIKKC